MHLFMKFKQNSFKIPFFLIIFTAFLWSCASSKAEITPSSITEAAFIPDEFLWQPVSKGIERFDFKNPELPVIYHAVKIDLTDQSLELICFPNEDTKTNGTGQFTGTRTSAFAKKNDCLVAVNASPFEGRFVTKKIVGIHSFNENDFSPALSNYAAICFSNNTEGYEARIVSDQAQAYDKPFDYAFGGFFTVLKDDQVLDSFEKRYDSRCGAGISKDGKTLYLLVVEGEYPKKSRGLSYPQCGMIFKAMGCSDALELDGGGSSQLCINGKSVLSYTAFRIQANSFGFTRKE